MNCAKCKQQLKMGEFILDTGGAICDSCYNGDEEDG